MDVESEANENVTSAKVLSCKRTSMGDSDVSEELPSVMDLMREPSLPTSFEPGMFNSSREGSQESNKGDSPAKAGSSSGHKKHHHHHNKAKKKKEKKKKHKHRRKHKPSAHSPSAAISQDD